jgi:hypothetical protein
VLLNPSNVFVGIIKENERSLKFIAPDRFLVEAFINSSGANQPARFCMCK